MKFSTSIILLSAAVTVNAIAVAQEQQVCALAQAPCSLDADCCEGTCEARGGEARWWRWCQPAKTDDAACAKKEGHRCQHDTDCGNCGLKCTPVGGEARFIMFCRRPTDTPTRTGGN